MRVWVNQGVLAMAKLQAEFYEKMRAAHYALNTERSYWSWIRRYILFHGKRHPKDMGALEVSMFLTHLATREYVAGATQKQALSALVFLYEKVLFKEVEIDEWVRPRKTKTLPVVLTVDEVRRTLACMDGLPLTATQLMYGAGLRVMEVLRLRIKDIDFGRKEITIRQGKGFKDRVTMLPILAEPGLRDAIELAKALHKVALAEGVDFVHMPDQLSKKYPNAGKELPWQYVFASNHITVTRLPSAEAAIIWIKVSLESLLIPRGRNLQARHVSYISAFVCHAFIRAWAGYKNSARAAWSRQCEYHYDLYACVKPWW